MKWLMVALVLTSSLAVAKSNEPAFNSLTALTESVLEQQRGGFYTADTHFSIGLSMKVTVNNRLALYSSLRDLLNGQANREITDVTGVRITPVLDAGKMGLIIKNSANNIKTNATVDINVKTPINYDVYRSQSKVATRVRAATQRVGY
ncbi:hypothetical protein GU3_00630 [Oceanimonas sp. GK1]|uniref:hypothetical protein n=1 Tax=Oceanimonas sp. (strain GK1 / IBRC-M 10197) TaxID=511062 RepID=UPI0002494CA2|nr:hypothetical protein [Oceanimonas sp. GK1]AEX99882.1 hypothetical protein GU3_00630 [Oceanimonas sp. GK1]